MKGYPVSGYRKLTYSLSSFNVWRVLCQNLKLGFIDLKLGLTVIPAQAGIQIAALVSRLRGNDVTQKQ
jgi:hypothetical protein